MVKTDPKIDRDNMSVAWVEKISEMAAAARQAMNDSESYSADQIMSLIPSMEARMKAATARSDVPTQMHVNVAMSVAIDVYPALDDTEDALYEAIKDELMLWILSEEASDIVDTAVDGYAVDGVVKVSPIASFPHSLFGLMPKKKLTKAQRGLDRLQREEEEHLERESEDVSGSRRTVPLGVIGELLSEQGISIGRIKQMTASEIGLVIDDIRAKLTLLSEIVEHHSDTPQRVLQHMDADAVREHAKFILRAPSVHRDNSECDHQFSMEHDVTGLGDGVLGVTGTCCKCGSTFDHQFKPTEVDWDDRA